MDLMCWDTWRWRAKRAESGLERIWVREVWRAWMSWGEGVAK